MNLIGKVQVRTSLDRFRYEPHWIGSGMYLIAKVPVRTSLNRFRCEPLWIGSGMNLPGRVRLGMRTSWARFRYAYVPVTLYSRYEFLCPLTHYIIECLCMFMFDLELLLYLLDNTIILR